MKAGDRIRVQTYIRNIPYDSTDYTVEEFRYCLGIFESNAHREARHFTPLCDLYEPGPESKQAYVANHGEYYTNEVQAWMDIPN